MGLQILNPYVPGLTPTNFTLGSVIFAGANGVEKQDNANFFYDIGTATLRIPTIAGGTTSSSTLTLLANTVTFDSANTGRIQIGERVNFNSLSFTTSATFTDSFISSNAVMTTSNILLTVPFVDDTRTMKYSTAQAFSANPTMFSRMTYTPTANGLSDSGTLFTGFIGSPSYKVDVGAGNSATTPLVSGFTATPKAGPRVSGTGTVTNLVGFQSWGFNFFTNDVYANNTVTNAIHLSMHDLSNGGTVTNQIGVSIPDLAVGTNIYGIQSALASATNKYFIYHSGTAVSVHTGNLRLGDTTPPTALLDLEGKLTITSAGLVTKYNNIATVSNGVPSEYVTVDLATQGAAIAATTLYAVPSTGAGMYRISWMATVTRASSGTSTLGGSAGFQIVYTDNDDSVVKTTPGVLISGANLNNTNSTATGTVSGCIIINAKASTNVQYKMDYLTFGATTMQYNLHIKLEAM